MAISFEERKKEILRQREIERRKQARKQKIPEKDVKLTKKDKKKTKKRAKRKLAIAGIIAALGITGGVTAAIKMLPEGKPQEPVATMEDQNNTKSKLNEFKERYHFEVDEKKTIQQDSEIIKEINELQNENDVLSYLKNMYIEKYEEKTGDKNLTTKDIEIYSNSQNYVYVDETTGDIITHGDNPADLEKMLQDDEVSYDVEYDVSTYSIENAQDGQIMDMIVMKSQAGKTIPVKVIPGNQYNEMKNYDSILDDMGTVIPDGLKYMENFEDENAKNNFIKALEDLDNQQEKALEDDEMGLE